MSPPPAPNRHQILAERENVGRVGKARESYLVQTLAQSHE